MPTTDLDRRHLFAQFANCSGLAVSQNREGKPDTQNFLGEWGTENEECIGK